MTLYLINFNHLVCMLFGTTIPTSLNNFIKIVTWVYRTLSFRLMLYGRFIYCDYVVKSEHFYSVIFLIVSVTALMLSALKAEGVAYSPASVKRTLENTAAPLGQHDKFSIGQGVIQVTRFS